MQNPIILVAGGTGGHLFPAMAVENALHQKGYPAFILTDLRGAKHIDAKDLLEHRLSISHNNAFGKAIGFIKDYLSAKKLFKKIKPRKVIGFGGYPSLAPLWAASSLNIPIIIHEQNALLGKANRYLASKAQKIALSFVHSQGIQNQFLPKCVFVGNPVRHQILDISHAPKKTHNEHFQILVTGGSQGAKIFSDIFPHAIGLLPKELQSQIKMTQQVRPEYMDSTKEAYTNTAAQIELAPFFNNIGEKILASDLIICRAGASTIAENLVLGAAGIYVPLPSSAENHQFINAQRIKDMGAGALIEQQLLNPKSLATEIQRYFYNQDLIVDFRKQAKENACPNAAENLANLIIEA
jgi:UDP-N-acetylglucosamine--N-acetylmuramyl-(pentapeptide) pyrophosphoryl-undecaprenol N-acetylglucosamine transferase